MITYRFKAYRINCNHSKRSIVQERLRVEDRLYKVLCLLGCKKSCIHLAKGFVKWYTRCLFWMYKIKDKENLKRVAWGLDVGQEDRTRINLLCLRLLSFLRFISLLVSSLYLTLISLFECWLYFRSYNWYHFRTNKSLLTIIHFDYPSPRACILKNFQSLEILFGNLKRLKIPFKEFEKVTVRGVILTWQKLNSWFERIL